MRARRASEDVIRQVLDRIRSGQIGQGDLLPGERTLAVKLEVSRPTVRLALSTLVDAGILEALTGRAGGSRVRSIWIPDELLTPRWDPQADELFELLEARRTLEPRVAQLAAVRATDDHLRRLQESIELQRANRHDRQRVLQMEGQFHRVLWQAAGNPTLEGMLVALFDKLEVALDMVLRTDRDTTLAIEIHEQTLQALRRADPGELERAMDEHMAYTENIVEEAVGRPMSRQLPGFLRGGQHARS